MKILSTTWSILSKRRSTAFSFWVIGVGLPAALLTYLFMFWDQDGPSLFDFVPWFVILMVLTAAYTWRNVGRIGKGLGIAGLQIGAQTPILLLIVWVGALQAIMPNARVNDPKLEAKFEERLSTHFGIEIGEDATVEYFTLWTIGAEHGFNLILRVEDFDPDKYAPTGSSKGSRPRPLASVGARSHYIAQPKCFAIWRGIVSLTCAVCSDENECRHSSVSPFRNRQSLPSLRDKAADRSNNSGSTP